MKLLVTENRPEDRVGKIDFEHPGKCGKRGKMELLVTETSSRNGVVKPQHGKAGRVVKPQHGKAGKARGVGVQELYFSTLSTLSRLFGVHF